MLDRDQSASYANFVLLARRGWNGFDAAPRAWVGGILRGDFMFPFSGIKPYFGAKYPVFGHFSPKLVQIFSAGSYAAREKTLLWGSDSKL